MAKGRVAPVRTSYSSFPSVYRFDSAIYDSQTVADVQQNYFLWLIVRPEFIRAHIRLSSGSDGSACFLCVPRFSMSVYLTSLAIQGGASKRSVSKADRDQHWEAQERHSSGAHVSDVSGGVFVTASSSLRKYSSLGTAVS